MKTRIIQTRFWDDDLVNSLSKDARYLWISLLTSKEIGMTNYFKLPDSFIIYYTGLTKHELATAKKELQNTGKLIFYKDWVFIKNLERENKYKNSPKLEKPYQEELSHIPNNVISYVESFLKEFNTSMDSTIDSTSDSLINSKIINNKYKDKKQKTKRQEILNKFNEILKTSYSSTTAWENNYKKWLEEFSQEQIIQAIGNIPKHPWLRDKKVTPAMFFRTDKDWIDQCLNLSTSSPVYRSTIQTFTSKEKPRISPETIKETREKIRQLGISKEF